MDDAALELISGDGGTQIRYRGRHLYPTKPISATRTRARRLEPAAEAVCILASPLLGYGVEELATRMPQGSILLCVEADPALLELSRRVGSVDAQSPTSVKEWMTSLPDAWFYQFRRVQVLTLNGGYRVAPGVYRELETLLRARLQRAWQNKMTAIHMGRLWLTNLIDNLPLLARCRSLRELTTRKPVAIVGAAPSLDRTADTLARHRASVFVLAVDTAYRSLRDRGIIPDAVCVVEAQHANLDDVLGTPVSRQPLCADISSYSALLRKCRPDNLFLFSSTFVETSLLQRFAATGLRPTTVPPLGSVGATAVELATRVTSASLLLFGLDFAFHHGKTHARATPQHRASLRRQNRLTGTDPAPFTLAARTIPLGPPVTRTDTIGHAIQTVRPAALTTSELRTYNLVAADLCRGKPAYDLGDSPTPLGRKVTIDGISPIISNNDACQFKEDSAGGNPVRLRGGRGIGDPNAVKTFIDQEIAELDTFSAALRSGNWVDGKAMLNRLDYLTIDFPEAGKPDRSAAPRLLASAAYYRTRWLRSRNRL